MKLRHIGRNTFIKLIYYLEVLQGVSKINFDECVPVATHWSKHIHRNYLLKHLATPPNNKNISSEVLQFVATKNGLAFLGNVLGSKMHAKIQEMFSTNVCMVLFGE